MAGSLSSINIRFQVNLSEFSTEMQNALKSVKKTGEQMKSLGSAASLYITAPIVAAGAASIKFASDYEESLNKVNVAFGGSAKAVESFGDSTLETYGIAKGTALDMASLFGDMGTSMGLPQSEAAKMSTSLVGLAGDLASFKNIGIEQATTALNGVFTGETESLKLLGIVMTDANLQTFAYSQGINKLTKNMSQGEKVQLRYKYILENTKNAQGDFARTSDGAANQTRIFQESLKQIGQQIGSVILPYFTKMISAVNEKLKAFSNLSDETKKLIVVIGGIAAVLGPLAFAIGTVLTLVPQMVAGFVAVKTAFTAFTATIAANPIGAIAVAIGLVVAALIAFNGETKKAVQEQSLLNKVNGDAVELYANQKVKVDELFKSAQNENLSKKERLAAIKALNKISPEYFGNLNLETINADKAREAQEKYTVALLNGAKAKAAQNILTQLTEERIKAEINAAKAVEANKKRVEELNSKTLDNSKLQQQLNKDTQNAALYQNIVKKAGDERYDTESKFLADIIEKNKQYIGLLDEDIVVTNNLITAKQKLEKIYTPDTIAFYENEISKLQELQKESTLTARGYQLLGQKISEFQSKIDALSAPVKAIEMPVFGSLKFYDNQITALKRIQDETVTTSDAYQTLVDKIKSLENQKLQIIDPASLIENSDAFKAMVERVKVDGARFLEDRDAENAALLERANETKEAYGIIGQGFVDIFSSFSQGFVESLGIANEGMKGFVSSLIGTITKLISMALSASMANSIQGATQSAVATGPGAVFAQPAFIATAIAGIIAAFASIPKFETGGIVGGSSFTGDKILARLNSGELVLNQKQQSRLMGIMADGTSEPINGGFELTSRISGSDIELVVNRAIAKNNRKG